MHREERETPDRLEELFHIATSRGDRERRRMLKELEREDADLARELGVMLDADREFDSAILRPQQVVGPYRLIRQIGEGGMGTVYLARQEGPMERDVALKVMQRGPDTEELVRRFRMEQSSLARMDHPGIARVFDAGETADGRGYFAMEYVPGHPITKHCDLERLSVPARVELLAEVCDAVQHAHQKGILHRDLKPSNVSITMRDGRYTPKVIDFGVAKSLGPTRDLTRTGFIGTPRYMSPEQAGAIPESVDSRSDVYSLGVILYELLVGEPPLDCDSDERGIAALFQASEIVRPSLRVRTGVGDEVARARRLRSRAALARRVDGDLDWITLRALAREPARRYASASELAEDLRRHLRREPVNAGAPGAVYRVAKWVSRHRRASVLIALLTMTIVTWAATQSAFNRRLRVANADLARLSDNRLLERLLDERDRLWPARPELIEEYDDWLIAAGELLERRQLHQGALRVVRSRGRATASGWEFDAFEDEWQHAMLSGLVGRLDRLAFQGTGAFDDVADRRRLAAALPALTLTEPASDWERAAAELGADPRFDGFTLEPILGLVPLGADPRSGLQEFAHVPSGQVPARDSDGRLTPGPEDGLVFVLIPGGRVLIGDIRVAMGHDEVGLSRPTPEDMPFRFVDLAPYLISKFEMTQAQWERATGSNPSMLPRLQHLWSDGRELPVGDAAMHPVESVSHAECARVLANLGLDLPTGAQWENAARAETTSGRWWDPNEPGPIGENIASVEAVEIGHAHKSNAKWSDGWPFHAPIGSFLANPYGLHDVLGNVQEHCKDPGVRFESTMRAGDGLRSAAPGYPLSEVRSGSYLLARAWATDFRSTKVHVDGRSSEIGVRPLHPLPR